MKKALFVIALMALMLASCGKTCRCYRYDGAVDEYSMEEIDEQGYSSCESLEAFNEGVVYSLCELVL